MDGKEFSETGKYTWNVFRYGDYHPNLFMHEQIRIAENICKEDVDILLESEEPRSAYLKGPFGAEGWAHNKAALKCLIKEKKDIRGK